MIAISNGSLIYETFKSIIRSFRKTSPPFSPSPFHGEGAGGEVQNVGSGCPPVLGVFTTPNPSGRGLGNP